MYEQCIFYSLLFNPTNAQHSAFVGLHSTVIGT